MCDGERHATKHDRLAFLGMGMRDDLSDAREQNTTAFGQDEPARWRSTRARACCDAVPQGYTSADDLAQGWPNVLRVSRAAPLDRTTIGPSPAFQKAPISLDAQRRRLHARVGALHCGTRRGMACWR
jgi:hypothetical protein